MGLSFRNTFSCHIVKASQLRSDTCNHFISFPEFIVKNLFIPIFVSLLYVVNISAQFNSLIFQKYLSPYKYGVVALGDQNSDGYDDILIYDCNEEKVYIFFGGSPMDTIPDLQFFTPKRSIVALDVNNDQKKDIVVLNQTAEIYYGGSQLDTIPDIEFHHPVPGQSNWGANTKVLKDFNGDGYEELVIYDPNYPFNGFTQYGIFYIYNTYPLLDTIPIAIIKGDTLNNQRLFGWNVTSGDLDGNGIAEFIVTGDVWSGPSNEFVRFYSGDSNWNLEVFELFYKNEHSFNPTSFRVIDDINGDVRDDILMNSYGEFYPYYYLNSILYGNIPIDTIPDAGLNTQNNAIIQNVTPGDVNGDGYNDLLAGTTFGLGPEQARLWVGGNPMPEVPKQYWGGNFEGYGKLIGNVGDVNGDGLDDICVGQSQPSCQYGFVLIFEGDTLFQQPVSVGYDINLVPEQFYLDNPYPNPFNPSTTISYSLLESGKVILTVYDVLGRKVKTLVDDFKQKGNYEIKFNAKNLSSGVYIYRITASNKGRILFTDSKQMILLR